MLTRMRARALCLLFVLLQLPASVWAAESYDNCTGYVDAVPAVITTQGTWCLRQDLATSLTSVTAITISVNNVTLDCNEFANTTASANYFAIGILASGSVSLAVVGTGTVARNRVSGLFTQLSGAKTTGILSGTSGPSANAGTFIIDNEIGGNLLTNSSGIMCAPMSVIRGNTINGFATPIEPGCTSAGANVTLP